MLAAARKLPQQQGEASSDQFGLTTPLGGIDLAAGAGKAIK